MSRRRTTTFGAVRQVTLIGHNNQVMPLVNLFAGTRVSIHLYTKDERFEEILAPYPDVEVEIVQDRYSCCPPDLPAPPYFLCVDTLDLAKRIRSWLPRTLAIFYARHEAKRRKNGSNFLHLNESEAQLRRNTIRRLNTIRRIDRLMDMAAHAEMPLILMYADPDPDAIGAACALATIWKQAGAMPLIRYTGEVQRYQNKLLLNYLDEPIERVTEDELAGSDLLALVDAQPTFWSDKPPNAQVVIDHHPRADGWNAVFADVRPHYGATATILIEYLDAAEIPIGRHLATALLYGLTTDTDELTRDTRNADIQAYGIVHGKADKHFISRLHKAMIPVNMLDYIGWGIAHRLVVRDLLLVHFGEVDTPDLLVQSADFLLLTRGINWVVCAGKVDDQLIVIFRGDGHRQDVGSRARKAFGKLGSAGGHRTMGRAEVPLDGEHEDATIDLLINNLFKRMNRDRRLTFIRLLRNFLHGPGPQAPERVTCNRSPASCGRRPRRRSLC